MNPCAHSTFPFINLIFAFYIIIQMICDITVKSKDPRPDPPPPPRPDVLPPPPGQVSIIGTVDPTAILKDNQKWL